MIFLAREFGIKAVVLEANRVGSGCSRRVGRRMLYRWYQSRDEATWPDGSWIGHPLKF